MTGAGAIKWKVTEETRVIKIHPLRTTNVENFKARDLNDLISEPESLSYLFSELLFSTVHMSQAISFGVVQRNV